MKWFYIVGGSIYIIGFAVLVWFMESDAAVRYYYKHAWGQPAKR